MSINVIRKQAVLAIALILGTSPTVFAKGEELRINEVVVDFNVDTITITGQDFDYKDISDLGVELGTIGDITILCAGPPAPTATVIVCDFSSAGGLPDDGDYLLTVDTSGKSKKYESDEYDLTIGAVGPQGLAGADGAPGRRRGLEDPRRAGCAPDRVRGLEPRSRAPQPAAGRCAERSRHRCACPSTRPFAATGRSC